MKIIYLIAVLFVALTSLNTISFAQRRATNKSVNTTVPKISTVGPGYYNGRVFNATKTQSLEGEVELYFSKFDKKVGEAEAVIEFSNGLCGEGDLTGIIDEQGVSLTGLFSCSGDSKNLILRCNFTGGSNLSCSYTAKNPGSSIVSQRGKFNLAKAATGIAISNSASTPKPVLQPITVINQPKVYRPIYKVTFPNRDFEFDIAMVRRDDVSLRTSPSTSAGLTKTLSPGNLLVLLDNNQVDGWIKAIDYKSGEEGWVPVDDIEIKRGTGTKKESLLERNRSASGGDPTVTIKNDSNRTLTLNFGTQRYTVYPNQTLEITVKPGNYRYNVFAPEVLPVIGEEYLDAGYKYTWSFYIQ